MRAPKKLSPLRDEDIGSTKVQSWRIGTASVRWGRTGPAAEEEDEEALAGAAAAGWSWGRSFVEGVVRYIARFIFVFIGRGVRDRAESVLVVS
jgi:hypothetical protein